MIEIGEEEVVNLDDIASGLSEIHPDKKHKHKNEKPNDNKSNNKITKKKLKWWAKASIALACVVAIIVSGYLVMIFGNIPFVTKWRNIWIETAMTTDQHKWLATTFFPEWLIDEVMSKQSDVKDLTITNIDGSVSYTDIYGKKSGDILGQSYLVEGEKDPYGNTVYANNIEEGVVILEVGNSNFVGKLVLVDDPSRVHLAATNYKGSRGQFICDYLERENAIVGTNASGFRDEGGVSLGGVVTGQCVSQGEYWGTYNSMYTLVGFDDNNRLVVGGIDNWEDYNIRDGFQYRPALIIDGKKVVEDSAGWGLQPRTVIGQCKNGVVLMLVADGRQVGYSLGATMEDCADILMQYGAVTAGACDGGSSSVIGYDGNVINRNSAKNMPTGRYLPNAWVVTKKSASAE